MIFLFNKKIKNIEITNKNISNLLSISTIGPSSPERNCSLDYFIISSQSLSQLVRQHMCCWDESSHADTTMRITNTNTTVLQEQGAREEKYCSVIINLVYFETTENLALLWWRVQVEGETVTIIVTKPKRPALTTSLLAHSDSPVMPSGNMNHQSDKFYFQTL